MKSESEVAQSCPTFCSPMDCSLSCSSFRGIFQARVLEWIAISFSRGSSRPRNQTRVSCVAGRHFTVWATREAARKRWMRIQSDHSCFLDECGLSKLSRLPISGWFRLEPKFNSMWDFYWFVCFLVVWISQREVAVVKTPYFTVSNLGVSVLELMLPSDTDKNKI